MNDPIVFKLKKEIDFLRKEIEVRDKHIEELLASGGKIREYLEHAEDMLRNLTDMDIRIIMEKNGKSN